MSVSVTGVKDPASNVGSDVTSVTRETAELGWVTIDTEVPVITWVDMVSNNAKHTQLAKDGDTIFLTVNASERIEPRVVDLVGRRADTLKPYGVVAHDMHYLFTSCPDPGCP